ncbi:VirE2 family protein [Microvirga tunisiensis]|uniref:Uncharacterized protein n=1 Tax=Microvirga tunisiensis TaxID=2108360 RepID=A0A5N7MMX9_9HYPH|nr:VirE2 family protein [Microvirga tunisiensis]MPR10169.1 hypothetical protein [Microvirga tunisiensis]MPR28375.1 hypothetical protein [Microvirga tunisiensis]
MPRNDTDAPMTEAGTPNSLTSSEEIMLDSEEKAQISMNSSIITPTVKRQRYSGDHETSSSGSSSPTRDLLNEMANLKLGNAIADDAYLLCKPGEKRGEGLEVLSRRQYIEKYGQPTADTFKNRSLLFNASLVGRDSKSFYPPPVLINRIPIPLTLENSSAKARYKGYEFKELTSKLEVPSRIYSEGNYKPSETQKSYMTPGGIRKQEAIYDNALLAGALNPDYIVMKGSDVIDAGWRKKGDKFTNKSVVDVEQSYGEGAKLILKSSTHAYTSTDCLREYGENEPDKRFGDYVGEKRTFNASLNPVVCLVGEHYISVKHTLDKYPNSATAKALVSGEAWRNVRVVSSTGNAWITPEYAMKQAPQETIRHLEDAGLNKSIAAPHVRSYEEAQKVGATMPAVAVPIQTVRHGPPDHGVDVLSQYSKEEIMIASRDKNGERTGNARTLASYAYKREPLPQDAADVLGVASDVYSRSAAHGGRAQYDERGRGKQSTGIA